MAKVKEYNSFDGGRTESAGINRHRVLVLDDYEEMSIAGIDQEADRSDESDQWQKDHYSDNFYNGPW